MENYFTDKRSMVEISAVIDFCEKLVIKDNDKAEAAESIESSTKAYELTRAMLRADRIENYEISVSNIKEVDPTCSTIQELRKKDYMDDGAREDKLLEIKRFKVYTEYMRRGEQNLYYKEIYDSYIADNEPIISNLEDFMKNTNLPFFVAARMYQNFSILYYKDGILTSTEVAKFKECYSYSLNYFMKTCYNVAYKIDNPNYDNLCKLVIIFLAIQRFLASRMENMDDIDFFDEYSIRNLFLSYGLDYFFDFPLKYQKRILKNINYLIKNKGTTKAIINVLDIFGFDNIKVMKYFICKEYEKDEAGNILIDKVKLAFYGIDAEETNISAALKDSERYTKFEYEDFIKDDKYWYISSETDENGNHNDDYLKILDSAFNFIYTKYISIDSFLNLTKFGIDFSNFASILYYIEDKYENEKGVGVNSLYFYDYSISPNRIKLIHALLALYSLTMKKFGYFDNIVKTPSAIARVYGFNYDDLVKDVFDFTKKYLMTKNLTADVDTLTENEEAFSKFLKKYNLNRNDVLVSHYIQQYVKLNINDENFKNIKETYKDSFNELAKNTEIESIIENYKGYKTNNFLSQKEYEKLAKIYTFESYIDIEDVYNYAERFLNKRISVGIFENFSSQFKLSFELETLTKQFVNGEITLTSFKNELPNDLQFRNVLANYYTDLYLLTIKNKYKENEFKNRYYITQSTVITLCDNFYNGNIAEEEFKKDLETRNLLFTEIYFKYLTYKLLVDGYSNVVDENIAKYLELINLYSFETSMLYEEIEYYRQWNKEGLLSNSEIESFLSNFYVHPRFEFYTVRGSEYKTIYLNNEAIQNKKAEEFAVIDVDKNMNQSTFVELFKQNNNFRKDLENKIIKEQNYRTFRYYQALYFCMCTSNYRYGLFDGYKTFYDYLRDKDINLANYIDKCLGAVAISPNDRETLFNQYILELCNGIESYLDDDTFDFFIQGNTILNDYIKQLIYQLIDFIKSYTIQLKDLNTILLFDEKFHNTFFMHEELGIQNKDYRADLENLLDVVKICNERGLVDSIPVIQDLLKLRSELTYNNTSEKVIASDKDVIKAFLEQDYKSELYVLADLAKIDSTNAYIDILHNLVDSVDYSSELSLKQDTMNTLISFIKEILAAIKKSDIMVINDSITSTESNIGKIDSYSLKEKLTAIVTIDDGLDTQIEIRL